MAKLILVRHSKSEWNVLGKWTGWTDVDLNEQGRTDAKTTAEALKDIQIDQAFVSKLKRAQQTLEIILNEIGQSDVPTTQSEALNERNYGIYTGKNKWEVKEEVGEEEFQNIRRGWEHPIPEGETMKKVYERVVPFYEETVLPLLKEGKNIILAAHGNSLRALVKYLEDLSIEELMALEFGIGEAYVYEVDEAGKIAHKEIRAKNPLAGKQ
jgi:2,3-bisphosphoglycerate-dependent phosphoglycerate mutase